MEDLLAHRHWVRALARRLAADESAADDLEQDAWIAALERPPADAQSLRGWLGTVVRNLHRNARRGAVRRSRRERTAIVEEREPDPHDVVAEAECQHRLVEEVLRLEEPYRTTVLLRWYDDLTPTRIAERMDVPLDTVKTRLRRAIERLRERMDDRHDGDRRAWCVALLGTVRGGERTSAAHVAAGGVAMGAATKVVIAAAVLVAVGAVWWSRSEESRAPQGEGSAAASSADASATTKRQHVSVDGAPAVMAIDRDLDLHGVVVCADGSPVRGAKIQAIDYPWRRTKTHDLAALFVARPGVSCTSGADGSFALRLRRGEASIVRVAAEGIASRDVGPFQAGERVRIELGVPVALHVTVRDEKSAPVEGGQLWLVGEGSGGPWVDARATTDANGRCTFADLPGGATAILAPLSGVGDFGVENVKLPASGDLSIERVVPAGRTVSGRVIDAVTEDCVVGARVSVGTMELCTTVTDTGGRFELRGVTGRSERGLVIAAPGYASAQISDEVSDVVVRLARGILVTGRVVGASAEPVCGACVSLEASWSADPVLRMSCVWTTTDADGRFRIANVAMDAIPQSILTAYAPGRGRVRHDYFRIEKDAASLDVGDVVLPEPRRIEGRVVRPDGTPWPGAEVRLVGPAVHVDSGLGDPGSEEERRSDDLGRFRFADLAPGTYTLQMPSALGWVKVPVMLTADRDVIDVVLPPATSESISVTLRDDEGAPVEGLGVSARIEGGGGVNATSDASGRATLQPPAGRHLTSIDVGGYSEGFLRVPRTPVVEGRREYAITVGRATAIDFRLLGPDGAPLPRAEITVEPNERAVVYSTRWADGAWTDADGRINVTLARRGEFTISFEGGVYDEKRRKTDSLLEARQEHVTAQTKEVTLRCSRVETGRTAVVVVRDAAGEPVADAEVHLVTRAQAARRTAKTDGAGKAVFVDLPAHRFTAVVPRVPDRLESSSVTFVPDGGELSVRFPESLAIAGRVQWSDGRPASPAAVLVHAPGTPREGDSGVFQTMTDAEGRFTIQVPTGIDGNFWIETVAADGKSMVRGEREFTSHETDLRLELKR
jgi:RNA polymerase sigma factor (sigma-70 family)